MNLQPSYDIVNKPTFVINAERGKGSEGNRSKQQCPCVTASRDRASVLSNNTR